MARHAPLPIDAWKGWTPPELHQRLRGIDQPWCVVGGWALDLWYGQQTRIHEDIEFTVLRCDLPVFRHALGDLQHYTAHSGALAHLPKDTEPGAEMAQVWCADEAAGCWRVDLMIEDGTPDVWVYKRDTAVRYPRSDMVWVTADGLPYLRPGAALLFKAKHRRPKDQIDFDVMAPRLPDDERAWLRGHLARLHPGHAWTASLDRA